MIQELSIFPRTHYTEAGQVGTREWVIDHDDNLLQFLVVVCESHWPGRQDCVPIAVQEGPFMGKDSIIKRNGAITAETIGALPTHNKYHIVAQYLLHKMTNCWPHKIPKPWHPPGTTLTIQTRGTAEVITVTPTGMRQGTGPNSCVSDNNLPQEALLPSTVARIIIPVTEYHVTCDRMTLAQVDKAFGYMPDMCTGSPCQNDWDNYEGCTNAESFMGAFPGTLLFDGYEVSETFVPHPFSPDRYRLTCILKQRNIMDATSKPPQPLIDCDTLGDTVPKHVGWNHDLVPNGGKFGWKRIKIRADDGNNCSGRATVCRDRYPLTSFFYLFGDDFSQPGDSETCDTDDPCDPNVGTTALDICNTDCPQDPEPESLGDNGTDPGGSAYP